MLVVKVLLRLLDRLRWALLLLILWFLIATGGYAILETWSIFDAIYMTIITVFTVGYQEVHTLTDGGRVWTMVVIVFGFTLVGVTAAELSGGPIIRLWRREKLNDSLARMSDHYIICGMGRVGWQVATALRHEKQAFAAIDLEGRHKSELEDWSIPYLIGDAADDNLLMKMGVDRAKGLVASVGTDAVNLYVVLTARSLNTDLKIAARAEEPTAISKLKTAGANHVIAPTQLGGQRLATFLVRPLVAEYIDSVLHHDELLFVTEEVTISTNSFLINSSIGQMQDRIGPAHQGPAIIAIKPSSSDEFLPHPPASRPLEIGDVVVASGSQEDIVQLRKLA